MTLNDLTGRWYPENLTTEVATLRWRTRDYLGVLALMGMAFLAGTPSRAS